MIDAVASLPGAAGLAAPTSGVERKAATALTGFTQPTQRTDFSQVLSQVARDGVSQLQAAEATSLQGLQGQASVQQVVEAVMSAEQTLNTAIAVRDKVVQAYQEISRMQI
jgi:flagellar hook-basal body complex protein FliE